MAKRKYNSTIHNKVFGVMSYPPAKRVLGAFMKDEAVTYNKIRDLMINEFDVNAQSLAAYIIRRLVKLGLLRKDQATGLYYITTTGKLVYKGSQLIMQGISLKIEDLDTQGKLKISIERQNL